MLVLVPVLILVTPLAPRPASRRVVAAPRRCVASCAGIRISSQEFAKSCVSELSVLPQVEVMSLDGRDRRCKKMVFLAAIRGQSLSAGLPFLVMHTWCPPVRVGYCSRASYRLANQSLCEHFFGVRHFARKTLPSLGSNIKNLLTQF